MNIAVTGATGFLGRYIVRHLVEQGHRCRCWYRPDSDRSGFGEAEADIDWVSGSLEAPEAFGEFCHGVDAVVHSALFRPTGLGFRAAGQTAFSEFVRFNLLGSLALMHAARSVGTGRFVFISTCAVHEAILGDRLLDEAHPLWPANHYGAHKAAIEKFIHAWGLGEGWPICAVRPTGIYGPATPPKRSRWFDIVRRVSDGQAFHAERGGKEVHACDVARAVAILLDADEARIAGQVFNCYDLYVAEKTVAALAKEISGSSSALSGEDLAPKHQIDTSKIRDLGMSFGGDRLLRRTVEQLVAAVRS